MKKLIYLALLLFGCLAGSAQTQLYPYYENGAWGLTNTKKQVIIAPQYDTAVFFLFDTPYAVAIKNKKAGTIAPDGTILISFIYDKIDYAPGGLGIGKLNGKNVLLNLETSKVIPTVPFDELGNYCHCKQQLFTMVKNGKQFLLNGLTGKRITPSAYDDISFISLSGATPAVIVKNGNKYGFVNSQTGALILPVKYEELTRGNLNYTPVIQARIGNSISYLDNNGKLLKKVTLKNNEAMIGRADDIRVGLANTEASQDLYVYNLGNNKWKLTVEERSSSVTKIIATYELSGYAAMEKFVYKKWDKNEPAVMKAVKDGKMGLINLKGEAVLPFAYDGIEKEEYQVFSRTKLDNKVGVLDHQLYEVKKPVLKQVIQLDPQFDAFLVETQSGRIGFMNRKNGKLYIPGEEE
jgi:hypothetical protein